MKYKYLLFDMDGTLCDSAEGVQKCFNYALSKFGKEVKEYKTLDDIIGPPIIDSFEKRGFTHDEAFEGLKYYRERYYKHGMLSENKLFDGIADLVRDCKNAGYIVSTATSKPEEQAKTILEYFNIIKYFDLVAGASLDETRSTKEDVLIYTLKKLGVKNKKEVLLIGDTKYDLIGAESVGVDALAVRYGYGTDEELKEYKSVAISDTVSDVRKFLLG